MAKLIEVRRKVKDLLGLENSGHGFDHVERVENLAQKLAVGNDVDIDVVILASLLHDVDDYKLFGQESADNLTNAQRIMKECGIDIPKTEKVCHIIANMGYSKLLAGIRPQSLEGMIVSDADMLDAMGINGIIRTLQYAFMRCQKYGKPIFDQEAWPELNLSAAEYKRNDRRSDNCINHFFEKTLRLKNLMMTKAGKKEAEIRHQRMVMFLEGFFDENNLPEWQAFLEKYLHKEAAA